MGGVRARTAKLYSVMHVYVWGPAEHGLPGGQRSTGCLILSSCAAAGFSEQWTGESPIHSENRAGPSVMGARTAPLDGGRTGLQLLPATDEAVYCTLAVYVCICVLCVCMYVYV